MKKNVVACYKLFPFLNLANSLCTIDTDWPIRLKLSFGTWCQTHSVPSKTYGIQKYTDKNTAYNPASPPPYGLNSFVCPNPACVLHHRNPRTSHSSHRVTFNVRVRAFSLIMAVDFTVWLHAKLRELNTDESVFGEYIIGILDDDDDTAAAADEKRDGLHEILSQIVEDPDQIGAVLDAILDRWQEHAAPKQAASPVAAPVKIDIDAQLAKLLEGKTITAQAVQKQQLTAEEKKIREQILAQYSQVELDECDDDDDGGPPPAGAITSTQAAIENDPLMEKNTNALDVQQLAKEKREQARQDSKAKKDKDKEDREKQKRDREDKKNARKTVKGERRR